MRVASALIATAMLGVAVSARAQNVRPGLWENTVTMQAQGGEMQAQMARMQAELERLPPEQRRQLEAMLSGRGMGMALGRPTTVRSCITPEQAARNQLDTGDSRCSQTEFSRSGNIIRFKFRCEVEGNTSTGEGEYTLVSDSEHRGRMLLEASRQGTAQRMEMRTSGRFVSADCGDVRPRP